MKFRDFLVRLAKAGNKQISRYVIGNPSVDYDSFFGSILFAYILTSTTGQLHKPIIDCSREELGLRFQIQAILQKVKIDPNIFSFRGQPKQTYQSGVFNLYDHNQREGIEQIQYIVDHHIYSPNKIKAKKHLIIDPMGSGLTILYYLLAPNKLNKIAMSQNIASPFFQKYYQFIKDESFQKLKDQSLIDKDVNEIIRYGVLIDTFNFDAKLKDRWTIFDKKAVEYIQEQQQFEDGHQWIQSLKFDEERNKKMTLHQSLIKDRKIYTYGSINATYSIIYLSPSTFLQHYKTELETKFDLFHQQADIYFFMFIYRHEKQQFKRQIMYRIKNKNEQRIEQALGECTALLNLIDQGKVGQWRHLKDPTATISRKKFEPIIQKAFQKAKI